MTFLSPIPTTYQNWFSLSSHINIELYHSLQCAYSTALNNARQWQMRHANDSNHQDMSRGGNIHKDNILRAYHTHILRGASDRERERERGVIFWIAEAGRFITVLCREWQVIKRAERSFCPANLLVIPQNQQPAGGLPWECLRVHHQYHFYHLHHHRHDHHDYPSHFLLSRAIAEIWYGTLALP